MRAKLFGFVCPLMLAAILCANSSAVAWDRAASVSRYLKPSSSPSSVSSELAEAADESAGDAQNPGWRSPAETPVFSLLEACPTGGATLGNQTPPDQTAYLAFARNMSETSGRRLAPDFRAVVDRMLASARSADFANELGMVLIAHKSGFAAVYVLARGAERAPRDAVIANDLGVALKVTGDYDLAAQAMLYAAHLAPAKPVVLTNLGFLAVAMGDRGYADDAFREANRLDPSEPHALAGLGMMAECRNDHVGAAKFFRAALRREFVPMAATGLQAAEASMSGEEVAAQREADAAANFAAAARAHGLAIPTPPLPRQWQAVPAAFDAVRAYDAANQQRIVALGRDFQDARERTMRAAAPTSAGGVTLFERLPDKELFELGNLARVYGWRLQELAEDYHRQERQILKDGGAQAAAFHAQWRAEQQHEEEIVLERNRETGRCGRRDNRCKAAVAKRYAPVIAHLREQVCKPQAAAGAAAYARFYPAWNRYWTQGVRELDEYYARSAPYLRALDPDWSAAANIWREIWIRSDVGNLLVDSIDPLWNSRDALMTDFVSTEFQIYCPQSAAATQSAPRAQTLTAAPEPPDSGCASRWDVDLGVARMRADCRRISFAYERGPFAALIGKTTQNWLHESVTILANPRVGRSDVLGAGAWRNYLTIGDHFVDYGSASPSGVRLVLDPAASSARLPAQMSAVSDVPVSVGTPLRYTPLPEIP